MARPTYERVNWENGILVAPAKVLEDNSIQDAIYECDTPLNAENLNKMDKGISDIYEYGVTSNEIAISDTEPTNEDTKIWINSDGVMRFKNGTDWQGTISAGGNTEPIGTTKMYFGATEPDGYKFVNGQALSRTEYSELFSLIGTTYGAGDESTTFNLPDMSGRVPVGLNVNKTWFNQLGKIGGSEEVTLTIEQMPSHTHSIGFDQTAGSITSSVKTGTQSSYGMNTGSTGGGQAHSNLQPYITVNYIMKVKNIASEQVIVPDYIPIGAEFEYNGTEVPNGYVEVDEKRKILWTNSNPTSAYADEAIINLTEWDYDEIEVIFRRDANQNYIHTTGVLPKGYNISLECVGTAVDGYGWIRTRLLARINDYSYKNVDPILQFTNSNSGTIDTSTCIPLYIIGYKTGLYEEVS